MNIYKKMKIFSAVVKESKEDWDSFKLLQSEITQYINKVKKVIPEPVKLVIGLTQKYNLLDNDSIIEIKDSNKSSLKELSIKYNINIEELEDLRKRLKELKGNIKLLPQFQSPSERRALELGKLTMDDLTIDLESKEGRNAATKMYMPVILRIVNGYVGKSSMSKQELISSALLGFTNAMNDWVKDKDGREKHVSFKTYAGYKVKYQILDDMNSHSQLISGSNWYNISKGLVGGTQSIDNFFNNDGDEFKQDRLPELGISPEVDLQDEATELNNLYKIIEDKFKARDVDIFYRYFGLKGYKKEKSKDIAKSFGMSEGNIKNSIINKMILFLKNDKKSLEILSNLQDIYNESLMIDLMGMSKEEIIEALSNDDMFILLEELNRWCNKDIYNDTINYALSTLEESDLLVVRNLIQEDYEFLSKNFKKNKKLVVEFLKYVYPAENVYDKSESSLICMMEELQVYNKKYNN